tara:strand:+ start:4134 stop:4946 length:813 start_codon:yes stop_codon:yes gene_type:complete
MKVHHLNCATLCPIGGRLVSKVFPSEVVCHCLLIETNEGLVLVDTGISVQDFRQRRRLGVMAYLLDLKNKPEETAIRQIASLGFAARDVTTLIPTHLDLDHAGGIADFPDATVHTLRTEYQAAHRRQTFVQKQRYRPCQWGAHAHWTLHDVVEGERWFGFEAVRQAPGLPPEILLIPLPGHTSGHFGVAIQTDDGWLFHVGDSYYHHNELLIEGGGPAGMQTFQHIVHENYAKAMHNQQRLRELHKEHGDEVTIISAHDPSEFARCCGHH